MTQIALIVGASRGIGLGLAKEFSRRGWEVTGTARSAEGEKALKAVGDKVRVETVDTADRASAEALRQRLDGQVFDLIIVNAGVGGPRDMNPRTVTDERATLTRYGGDEFVLILPGHTLDEGMVVAENIRLAIREATFLSRPYGFNSPPLNLAGTITASLGVSSIRTCATPAASVEQQKNELLRAADAALYKAKQHGKAQATAAVFTRPAAVK